LVLLTLSFGELNERASSSGLLRLDEVRSVEVGSVMLWYTFSFGELNEKDSRLGKVRIGMVCHGMICFANPTPVPITWNRGLSLPNPENGKGVRV